MRILTLSSLAAVSVACSNPAGTDKETTVTAPDIGDADTDTDTDTDTTSGGSEPTDGSGT